MTLHLEYQSTPGGSYTAFDLVSNGAKDFRFRASDEHPTQLSFSLTVPQHTMPLQPRWFIRFWDDAGTTPDGAAQSSSNPLFEGHIWDVEPADSNLVTYTAYDPTLIAGREVPVMSTTWSPSAGPGLPPEPDSTAVPRLIFNSTIEADADTSFERAAERNIGEIIAIVLDDAVYPLHWYNAAPSPAGTSCYINTDLANFVYEPQAKIVSTNESIRQFVDRLVQQHYPEYAFMWTPGTRLWHFFSRLSAPAETLTLNTTSTLTSGNQTTVLGLELHRSLEGRFPAVEIYGPETSTVEIFSTLDGTLAPIGTPTVLENFIDSGGLGTALGWPGFQIVDAAKRRGSRFLPSTYLVRENDYYWAGTRSPVLEFSFDLVSWQAAESIWFDFREGQAILPCGADGTQLFIYFWSDHEIQAGSSRHYWTPNAYRLVWAPYSTPLTVRWPTSGYDGTSYSVAGQQSVFRQYDELLAVDYNRVGTPVTTASRRAKYLDLCKSLHAAKKDIVYTGGALLDGCIYDFCRLNKAINLAAVDADGATLTTGWESIKAIVTDCEIDFGNQTTQLTFSQQSLAAFGDNIDLLKQRLNIGLVQKLRDIKVEYEYSTFQSPYTMRGPITYVSGIRYSDQDLYFDPTSGTTETAQ